MCVEWAVYFEFECFEVEFKVSLGLLYFGLEDGLEAVFLVFETDNLELVLGELFLDDEDLAVDLL